jgi:hypothetical protein
VGEMDAAEFQDFLIAYPERWAELLRLHLCVAHTFNECISLLSRNRPATLQRALDDGLGLMAHVRIGGLATLRSDAMQLALEEDLKSYPNDLTARILEDVAKKRLPAQLSKAGSMNVLGNAGIPVTHAGSRAYPTNLQWRDKLNATPWAKCKIQIDRMRPLLPAEARGYADALVDLAKLYDKHVLYPPLSVPAQQEAAKNINDARVRLHRAFVVFRRQIPQHQEVTAEEPKQEAQLEDPDGDLVPVPRD